MANVPKNDVPTLPSHESLQGLRIRKVLPYETVARKQRNRSSFMQQSLHGKSLLMRNPRECLACKQKEPQSHLAIEALFLHYSSH